MFTGIVEEIGRVKSMGKTHKAVIITVNCEKIMEDVKRGDSIAVNGVCLTVASLKENEFTADVMPETVNRTNLRDIRTGDPVNLERALKLSQRLGGHIVSGHIDGTGTVESMHRDENALWITIKASPDILKYIVEKGSVAIDGISLTAAYADAEKFSVSIIPHTLKNTVLGIKKAGDRVNLECDIVGKYVERLMGFTGSVKEGKKVDMGFLAENGFV